jgi:hypothetical protein
MYSMELCKEFQKVAIEEGIEQAGGPAKLADILDVSRMAIFRWKAAEQEMGVYKYYKLMFFLNRELLFP